MKKVILIGIATLLWLTGCSKEQNITFQGKIEAVYDGSIMVTTSDEAGFDKASVGISSAEVEGNLEVGSKVKITVLPEIRETYPVQLTAVKVEDMAAAYEKISPEEAKAMMDEGDCDIVLDVRTEAEYNEGHIEGAVLFTDSEIEEKAEAMLPDKDEVVLVYCRSGRRSEAAAKVLIKMGYTRVYDFGGIMDWPYEVINE